MVSPRRAVVTVTGAATRTLSGVGKWILGPTSSWPDQGDPLIRAVPLPWINQDFLRQLYGESLIRKNCVTASVGAHGDRGHQILPRQNGDCPRNRLFPGQACQPGACLRSSGSRRWFAASGSLQRGVRTEHRLLQFAGATAPELATRRNTAFCFPDGAAHRAPLPAHRPRTP